MGHDSRTRGDGSPLAVLDAMPGSPGASESLLLPEARRYKTLRVVLIKPSKYDDEGYVIRFWRGVLPSNTLNVLHGLTVDVAQKRLLGDIEIQVDTFDETTQKVPVKKIVGWSRRPATKLIVGLVGVQTNQFPRALDLGREFRAHGLDVLMGGFHTSGTINMLSEQEPDIQTLFRESIVVVSGEVEGSWGRILADALNGRLQRLYSFAQDLKSLVDIEAAPLPVTDSTTMRHFARSSFGTVETSRGCPFTCSFCTIINVQGRTMRERSPEAIVTLVRDNYRRHGIDFYFFTDDNFARKKYWRETFEGLIRLRKEEGINVTFMMQVDLARKPADFVRLAAEAGCTQVFMGLESVNPENLKTESKRQNKVEEYQDILREWHAAGIVVHAAYIIGLPFDTQAQVGQDVQYLIDVIQPDQASFFMLTPLPGSHDHREMQKRGDWMDPDLNKRDSFHATIRHPHMTAEEWTAGLPLRVASLLLQGEFDQDPDPLESQCIGLLEPALRVSVVQERGADRARAPHDRGLLPAEGPPFPTARVRRRPLAGAPVEAHARRAPPVPIVGRPPQGNGRDLACDPAAQRPGEAGRRRDRAVAGRDLAGVEHPRVAAGLCRGQDRASGQGPGTAGPVRRARRHHLAHPQRA